MHHRRSRTTRRENKRLDTKAYRAAETRALDKGSEPDVPRMDSWSYRPNDLPLGDVPCNGKRHGRKKGGKQRDRCTEGGSHEWYYEWTEEKDFFRDIVRNCDICARERPRWVAERERKCRMRGISFRLYDCPYNTHWCRLHGKKHYYTERTKIGTCLKCWKTKIVKRVTDKDALYPDYSYYGLVRTRTLPKRAVQF